MKRSKVLLLAAVMLLGIFAASCGDGTPKAVMAKVDHVYRTEFLSLPDKMSADTRGGIKVEDGSVIMMCREVVSEDPYEQRQVLCKLPLDGGEPDITELKTHGTGDNVSLAFMETMPDGGIVSVESSYDAEAQKQSNIMYITSADGKIVFEGSVKDFFPNAASGEEDMRGGFYLSAMAVDGEGSIYLGSDQAIAVVSKEGKKLFDCDLGSWMDSMAATADGRVYVRFYDRENGGNVFKFIDKTKKSLGDDVPMPKISRYSNTDIFMGPDYELYLKDMTGLYGWNNGDAETTLLCNWINSDVSPNSVNDLTIISKDKLLCYGYDQISEKWQISVMTRVPDEEVKEKYLIRLAVTNTPYELVASVVKFNQTSELYRVTIDDYSRYATDDDYSAGQTTLNAEIVSGNVPDILAVSGIDSGALMSKGVFADLYPYLDALEGGRESISTCVRTPLESSDGKLFQLATSFYLTTLVGKTSIVGEKEGWTIDEFFEFSGKSDKLLFTGLDKTNAMTLLLMTSIADFIDYDTGKCSFDDGKFVRLLNYANTFESEIDYSSYEEDNAKAYRNDSAILNMAYIDSFSSYLQIRFKFGFDNPITFKGYPGSGCGAVVMPQSSYAIAARSPVKDGAWDFLKTLISDEFQTSRYSHGWPVTASALDKKAEDDLKQYYFFRYDGGYSSGSSPERFGSRYSEADGEQAQLSQADIDYIKSFLTRVGESGRSLSVDEKLLTLITEDTSMFFSGSKSAEETAKVVQSRVSMYIAENY